MKKMNGGSGLNSPELLAIYDPDTSSWKTPQVSLLEGLDGYSETWPTSGTMRNGKCFRQERLVPDIDEIAHSWWPTPLADDWKGGTERPRTDAGIRSYELRHLLKALFGGTLPHPQFAEQLMGFPIEWTDLGHLGTL